MEGKSKEEQVKDPHLPSTNGNVKDENVLAGSGQTENGNTDDQSHLEHSNMDDADETHNDSHEQVAHIRPLSHHSYYDSDSDIIDYDYDDGRSIPGINSDSDADSWDWTFHDERLSDLDVVGLPKMRQQKNLDAITEDSGPSEDTKTPTSVRSNTCSPERKNVPHSSNQNVKNENNKDSKNLQSPFQKEKVAYKPSETHKISHISSWSTPVYNHQNFTTQKRESFSTLHNDGGNFRKEHSTEMDVVYFEDASTPYLLKTRLKYLNKDSRVYPKTRYASRDRYPPKRPTQVTFQPQINPLSKKYGIRNSSRGVSKLDYVEAKFMFTGHLSFNDRQPLSIPIPQEEVRIPSVLSLSMPPPKRNPILPPIMKDSKRRGSLFNRASKRQSLIEMFSENITWRTIGRALSKRDMSRKSMTKEAIQKDVEALVARSRRKTRTALQRFRHAGKMVILMLRAVGLKPARQEETNYNFLSWTVMYDEVLGISRLNYDSGGLTFDPMLYKANKESTITQEVKDILRLPSDQRTDADVHTVTLCLQHVVPSFAEFPIRIQQSMIKVCTYEKFESGRVIIRQGHRAENFYFILSGCAVVTEMESRANHVHTTNLLGKGNSFGELAFLNMAKRSATVTCRGVVELICIEREDFIDIFMRRIKGKEPEHIIFLKEVELLKGWPIKLLPHDNPKICAFTFVRRGVILCHDSAKSDWIIVVVSGSCKVLKALDDSPVKHLTDHRRSVHLSGVTLSHPASSFPKIYSSSTTPTTNNNNNRQHQQKKHRFQHLQQQQHQQQQQQRGRRHGAIDTEPSLRVTSWNTLGSRNETDLYLSETEHIAEINSIYYKKHVLPSIVAQRRKRDDSSEIPASNQPGPQGLQPPTHPMFRPKRQSYGLQPPALPQLLVTNPDSSLELQKPLKSKVFIELTRLEPGDVFGLEQVVLTGIRDVTSCSLVSEGAEVVLISKKFFTRHLTEETTKSIRELIRPLPSEETLLKNLRTKKSWDAFKAHTVAQHSHYKNRVGPFLKT